MYHNHQDIVFLIESRRYDYAIEKLNDRLTSDFDDKDYLFYLLSFCYSQLVSFKEAEFYIKKALEFSPHSTEFLNQFADIEIEKGNLDEGFKILNQSLKIDPEQEDVFFLKSRIHLFKKELKQATENADLALAINPDNIDASNIKALGLILERNYKEATKIVNKTMGQNPLDSFSLVNIGLLKYFDNQIVEAKRIFQQALANDPHNETIRYYLRLVITSNNTINRKIFQLVLFSPEKQALILGAIIISLQLTFAFFLIWVYSLSNYQLRFDTFLLILFLWMHNIIFIPLGIIAQINNFVLYFDSIGKYLIKTIEIIIPIISLMCILLAIGILIFYFNASANMEHLLVLSSYFIYLSSHLGRPIHAKGNLKKIYIVKIVEILLFMTVYSVYEEHRILITVLIIISMCIYPIFRGYFRNQMRRGL